MQQNYSAAFFATGSWLTRPKSRRSQSCPRSGGPQVARNAMRPLGTWGAINIRFLFGLPFSPVHWLVEKMQVQSKPELVSLAEGVGVLKDPSGTR
jgi:hypothetical protein